MTFRTRTAPKPTRRRARRSDTRRAIYVTILFTLAIVSSLSLMGGVFLASYYTDHGAAVAAVGGTVFSKDAVRDRAALDIARNNRLLAEFQTLRNQGKITTDEYSAEQQTITTNESTSTIYTTATTELINEAEINQYAAQNNITVTDQQVDAQIKTDGTIAEMRHVKVIAVATIPAPPASSPSAADEAAALAKAQGYLKEIQGGKKWDDVYTESSTSSTSSSTGGDQGLVTEAALNLEPNLASAVFALQKVNDITPIIQGTDGVYRFATVTSIVPETVDGDWLNTIDATANSGLYRDFARSEAIKKAVQDSIEAKYITGPTVQRRVLEIAVSPGYGQPGDGDEVKIKMMVFSPNHDQANASTIAPTDPAWADAKSRADAAVAALRADPSQFDTMAADTTKNDDKNWSSVGGDVPWIPAELFNATTASGSQGLDLPSVAAAVFQPGLTPGTILDPIQETSQGYVVVDFQGTRPAPAQRIANAQFLINNGEDFATVAKQYSEKTDAASGAELGWVSPYMLATVQQQAIFSTPVGRVSNMVSSNGYYIYKVLEEQTRVADASQQANLKKVVFPAWLAELQANALVWQDSTAVSALAPATPS